jgi:hypothetical protein
LAAFEAGKIAISPGWQVTRISIGNVNVTLQRLLQHNAALCNVARNCSATTIAARSLHK